MVQSNHTFTRNTTMLSTAPLDIHQKVKAFVALDLALAFLIILMNAFVLVIFQVKKNFLLKSPVNIILCSFTMNDAIAGLSILFHVVPFVIEEEIEGQRKYEKVFDAAYMISKFCLLSSVGHLLFLSYDRSLAVVSPLKHKIRLTRAYAIVWLLAVWFIAIIFPTLEYVLYRIIDLKVYTLIIFICFVLIPLVILLQQYIITVLYLRKNVKKSKVNSLRKKARCKKAFVLHLIMFLSFFICVAPFVSIRIIFAYNENLYCRIPSYVTELFFLLRFLTSFTNALIFTIYKTDFLNVMKVIFCCNKKAQEELELILLKRTNSLHRSSYCNARSQSINLGDTKTLVCNRKSFNKDPLLNRVESSDLIRCKLCKSC